MIFLPNMPIKPSISFKFFKFLFSGSLRLLLAQLGTTAVLPKEMIPINFRPRILFLFEKIEKSVQLVFVSLSQGRYAFIWFSKKVCKILGTYVYG